MIRSGLLAVALAGSAVAQRPTPPPPGAIAMARAETQTAARLNVSSTAFADGATLPRKYSRYFDNVSPPLAWAGAPAATRAYAVIVDDPDASIKPVTHWTIWNLSAPSLPENVATGGEVLTARQGLTTMRSIGYAGPHPPVGDPPHHYHFQVFALDTPLDAAPGADRATLLAAMRGHVIAKGELIALYGMPTAPMPNP